MKIYNESTKTKAVLGGKTKLYQFNMANGKELVMIAKDDADAIEKGKAKQGVRNIVRLSRKSQALYTI